MKRSIRLAITVLAVALCATWAWADHDSKVADISYADLVTAMQAKHVTLLDCNGSKSYTSGHIPGAIDFNAHQADLASVLPKDKDALIVAYCGGPQCMMYKKGAAAALELGYTNVRHFVGGLKGWAEANGKLETRDGSATMDGDGGGGCMHSQHCTNDKK